MRKVKINDKHPSQGMPTACIPEIIDSYSLNDIQCQNRAEEFPFLLGSLGDGTYMAAQLICCKILLPEFVKKQYFPFSFFSNHFIRI